MEKLDRAAPAFDPGDKVLHITAPKIIRGREIAQFGNSPEQKGKGDEEIILRRMPNDGRGTTSPIRLMTPEQCAAFLQVEVATLYVMKSQGRIPYRKVGNRLRFDLAEIVEWTKGNKRQ